MGHEVQVYCRCGFKDRHTFINLGQTSELPLLFSSLLQFKKTMVTCVSSIRRFKEGISDTYKLDSEIGKNLAMVLLSSNRSRCLIGVRT